jgi:hypothetical protein
MGLHGQIGTWLQLLVVKRKTTTKLLTRARLSHIMKLPYLQGQIFIGKSGVARSLFPQIAACDWM